MVVKPSKVFLILLVLMFKLDQAATLLLFSPSQTASLNVLVTKYLFDMPSKGSIALPFFDGSR